MPIYNLDLVRRNVFDRIRKVAANHHQATIFLTYFSNMASSEYIINIVAEMDGNDDVSWAARTLLLTYLGSNSMKGQWMDLRTGNYGKLTADQLDAETRNTLSHFAPTSHSNFAFSQIDHLVRNNPVYAKAKGRPGRVPNVGGDLTSGVCLSLCYDWVRRIFAGAPMDSIANNGIPQHVLSMQRAYQEALGNGLTTNNTWLPMLAKGDGLTCTVVESVNTYKGWDLEERALSAWKAIDQQLNQQPAVISLISHTGHVGHAIGIYRNQSNFTLFDPNFGAFAFWDNKALCTGFVLILQYNAQYFSMAHKTLVATFSGALRPKLAASLQ
jgi:hypothetical protein